MDQYMTLNDISVGESAVVREIDVDGSIKSRFHDIGLVEGTRVRCELTSPLGDPIAFDIRGALIAIRREDARGIAVEPCQIKQSAALEVENEWIK